MKPATLQELASLVDKQRAMRDPVYMSDVDSCEVCSKDMSLERFLVDGAVHTHDGQQTWARLCAACFVSHGVGIRWGAGQLFERTSDESWLLVAGFPPD